MSRDRLMQARDEHASDAGVTHGRAAADATLTCRVRSRSHAKRGHPCRRTGAALWRPDKSALVVDGRSILERQLSVLREVTDDILLVGSRHPLRIPAGRRRDAADCRIASPDCGPLGGLDAALAACRAETLIVVACDMPFVDRRLPAPSCSHWLPIGRGHAVVPRTERGYHPLCAVYTRACAPIVARHLAERRLKLVELLDVLNQSGRGRLRACR